MFLPGCHVATTRALTVYHDSHFRVTTAKILMIRRILHRCDDEFVSDVLDMSFGSFITNITGKYDSTSSCCEGPCSISYSKRFDLNLLHGFNAKFPNLSRMKKSPTFQRSCHRFTSSVFPNNIQ